MQNIKVLQQAINEKAKKNLRVLYQKNNINHEIFAFDDKLLTKVAGYDLAITRAGASTISELSYLNIPFVAIPFPYAKDNHQYYNAKFYEKNECCWLIMQKDINKNNFTGLVANIFEDHYEYFSKKKNLFQMSRENTWEKNKCCWLITQNDIDENNFIDLMNKIFENKNEYFSKKKNLIELTKENTWEKNKFKLIKLLDEN